MGKRKKEDNTPELALTLTESNVHQKSSSSVTELSSKRKRSKHTDGEIQSTENTNENKIVSLAEDLAQNKKNKKSKKHKHAEKEDESENKIRINKSIKHTDSTAQLIEENVQVHDDGNSKSKRKKAKKKKHESHEDSSDASKIVHDKTENNKSSPIVDSQDVTEKLNSENNETERRKQKKKDKKLKKELKKGKDSEKVKDPETPVPVGPTGGQMALDYLTQWNTDKEHWKFQKVRQVWLLQNIYHGDKIEKEHFKVLLLYLEGMKGNSREITVKQAEKIIAVDEDTDEKTTVSDVTEVKLERARQIIQVLAE